MRRLVPGLLVLLLLGGCGEEDPGDVASAVPTPSSTPVKTTTPERTSEPIDFVRRYVAAMNTAGASGDTTDMRRLSNNCDQCDQIAAMIDRTYKSGGRIEGQGWDVSSARVAPGPSGDPTTFVEAHIEVHAQSVFSTSKGTPKTYQGNADRLMVFSLLRKRSAWTITAISVLGES